MKETFFQRFCFHFLDRKNSILFFTKSAKSLNSKMLICYVIFEVYNVSWWLWFFWPYYNIVFLKCFFLWKFQEKNDRKSKMLIPKLSFYFCFDFYPKNLKNRSIFPHIFASAWNSTSNHDTLIPYLFSDQFQQTKTNLKNLLFLNELFYLDFCQFVRLIAS